MARVTLAVSATCAFYVMLGASVAFAGKKEKANVLHHIATAKAITILCPKYEVNMLLAAAAATVYQVDIERESRALIADANRQVEELRGYGEEATCFTGQVMYGPEGTAVKGLLQER